MMCFFVIGFTVLGNVECNFEVISVEHLFIPRYILPAECIVKGLGST